MMREWSCSHVWTFGPVGMLVIAALVLLPFWRICVKAGFPGLMALFVFIPVVNVIFIYWLAFADWPSLRRASRES